MLNWDDPIGQLRQRKQQAPQAGLLAEEALQRVEREERASAPASQVVTQPAPVVAPPAAAAAATGLEQVEFGARRLVVDDKAMIN